MTDSFDILVVGGGPGGYVAAIRAAQLGFKTAVVESRKTLGGTCLNVGCIPSKALLSASHKYHEAKHGALAAMGVKTPKASLDLKAMLAHKDAVVGDNTKGIDFLFKKNKITRFEGLGTLQGGGKVAVKGKDKTTLSAKHIILATGSEVASLPFLKIDEKNIVSSTGALEFDTVPKSLAVIGGGYIGLEMAAVWSRLGSKVTVVEYLDRILPGMDGEISKTMLKILKKEGIDFKLSTKVTAAKSTKKDLSLTMETASGGKAETLKVEKLLVAVGRKANTEGLGCDKAGVDLDERGRVKTDAHFKTSAEGIYAIGDVIAGPMLAHKAEEDGVALAEILAGQAGHVDYDLVPGVVYTHPEAAMIGKTEEQLKEAGTAYNVGKFPFMANGRARSMNEIEGFVKILADKKTDRVLGAHIIGPEAGTLIHEVAVLMAFGGSSEDLARTCHAHPTLNETVKEAALAVTGAALHV